MIANDWERGPKRQHCSWVQIVLNLFANISVRPESACKYFHPTRSMIYEGKLGKVRCEALSVMGGGQMMLL